MPVLPELPKYHIAFCPSHYYSTILVTGYWRGCAAAINFCHRKLILMIEIYASGTSRDWAASDGVDMLTDGDALIVRSFRHRPTPRLQCSCFKKIFCCSLFVLSTGLYLKAVLATPSPVASNYLYHVTSRGKPADHRQRHDDCDVSFAALISWYRWQLRGRITDKIIVNALTSADCYLYIDRIIIASRFPAQHCFSYSGHLIYRSITAENLSIDDTLHAANFIYGTVMPPIMNGERFRPKIFRGHLIQYGVM
jgi:hypothetical protein